MYFVYTFFCSGPETVVDVLQSQSSRSDRSPGDSGFSLDEPDFGEEDAHQYIVKGKGGCRRRQLSQNKTDQRCSSVDLDPGDFMPEVEWDDLGDDDGDDSDIGEDVDDSNGASWISGEGSVRFAEDFFSAFACLLLLLPSSSLWIAVRAR